MRAILDDESTLSKVISFLRFPLIVAVVFIHCHAGMAGVIGGDAFEKFPVYSYLSYSISQILARLAVPLFFFVSGFLFFYKVPHLNRKVWIQKIRRRKTTLLYPYLAWNTLYLLLYFVPQCLFPSLRDGKSPMVYDYGWSEYVRSYWDILSGFPIDYPLWFLRDLILLSLLTPVFYFLIRRAKMVFPIVLGGLWLADFQLFPVIGEESVFFYILGAYFSVNGLNFVRVFKSVGGISLLIYGILFMAELAFCANESEATGYVHRTGIFFGMVAVIHGVSCLVKNHGMEMNALFSDGAFAVYVFHAFPLIVIVKCLCGWWNATSELSLIAIYWVSTLLVSMLGIALYGVVRRIHPGLCSLLFGSR